MKNGVAVGSAPQAAESLDPVVVESLRVAQAEASRAELARIAKSLRLSVEIIDPETATKWLATGGVQRPPSKANVANLTRVMANHLWKLNGESIIFDDEGCLTDGQHRLRACVASGVTIAAVVVRGVPRECFWSIDSNKMRTAGDLLGALDEKCHNAMAATIGVMWRHETGKLESDPSGHPPMPREVLLAFREKHGPELRRSTLFVSANAEVAAKLFTGRILTYAHLLFSRVSTEAADEFVQMLNRGDGHEKGSPVLVLRERMMNAKLARERLFDVEVLGALIRAWNDWTTKKTKSIARVRLSGYTNDGRIKLPDIATRSE